MPGGRSLDVRRDPSGSGDGIFVEERAIGALAMLAYTPAAGPTEIPPVGREDRTMVHPLRQQPEKR
jgi:hypothetical protein